MFPNIGTHACKIVKFSLYISIIFVGKSFENNICITMAEMTACANIACGRRRWVTLKWAQMLYPEHNANTQVCVCIIILQPRFISCPCKHKCCSVFIPHVLVIHVLQCDIAAAHLATSTINYIGLCKTFWKLVQQWLYAGGKGWYTMPWCPQKTDTTLKLDFS